MRIKKKQMLLTKTKTSPLWQMHREALNKPERFEALFTKLKVTKYSDLKDLANHAGQILLTSKDLLKDKAFVWCYNAGKARTQDCFPLPEYHVGDSDVATVGLHVKLLKVYCRIMFYALEKSGFTKSEIMFEEKGLKCYR